MTEDEGDDTDYTESRLSSIGIKCKPVIEGDGTTDLTVCLSFALYYRSFPTRSEYEDITASMEGDSSRSFSPENNFYRRFTVSVESTIPITNSDPEAIETSQSLTSELEDQIQEAFDAARSEHILYSPKVAQRVDEDLEDEETFSKVREQMAAHDPRFCSW